MAARTDVISAFARSGQAPGSYAAEYAASPTPNPDTEGNIRKIRAVTDALQAALISAANRPFVPPVMPPTPPED